MANFDDVMETYEGYKSGYDGSPPKSSEEYTVWKNKFPNVFSEESQFPEWSELEPKLDDEVVRKKRSYLYPEIHEQLDMLWHAIDSETLNKTSDFYKVLKKVKDDNPKST